MPLKFHRSSYRYPCLGELNISCFDIAIPSFNASRMFTCISIVVTWNTKVQCTGTFEICMFDFYRNCCWLVRSCTLVARQEPMAVEIQVHLGPVRGPGRCQAALHPDAQNCPTSTPRSPDSGHENELLQQSFLCYHIPVQRTRYYKARVLTLQCLNVNYLHSEQANNELMSCICMMGNFLLSGLFGISVCCCCVSLSEGRRGVFKHQLILTWCNSYWNLT